MHTFTYVLNFVSVSGAEARSLPPSLPVPHASQALNGDSGTVHPAPVTVLTQVAEVVLQPTPEVLLDERFHQSPGLFSIAQLCGDPEKQATDKIDLS